MSARRVARAAGVLSASVVALAVLGCVTRARDEAAAARTRYEACVAESGERACAAERERMLAAQRTYQESAQRAWGCDPAQGDCPTRR